MLLLSPFIAVMAVWQSIVMFFCVFYMVWQMLKRIDKDEGPCND